MNFMIYRLGELFCGPGGLAYGAINADIGDKNTKIIHAWANDIDKTTCQTFAINIFKNFYFLILLFLNLQVVKYYSFLYESFYDNLNKLQPYPLRD